MKRMLMVTILVLGLPMALVWATGGMTQDLDAKYVVGKWSGEEGPRGRDGRTIDLEISNLQDDGTVMCKRHLGALRSKGGPGSMGEGPKDDAMTGVIKKEGSIKLFMTPQGGGNPIIYRLDGKKLVREHNSIEGTLKKK